MLGESVALAALKSRRYAIFFAFVTSMVPFLNWISAVIVGLVTLAQGAQNGFIVLLWAALPAVVVLAVKGLFIPFIHHILLGTFLVWCLACTLKVRHQWSDVIGVAVFLGTLVVVGMHLAIPNLQEWWINQLSAVFQRVYGHVSYRLGMDQYTIQAMGRIFSPYMTGMDMGMFSGLATIELMIARMFQAKLYQLKCWKKEWDNFKIHYIFVVLLGIFSALAVMKNSWGQDLLLVFVWPFLLAGVSLIHVWLNRRTSTQTRVLLYSGMMVMAIIVPIVLSLLVLLAALDSLLNFRSKFGD